MSKWLMRGHFGHLHFKNFPMTPRAFKCKEIWPLQSRSEFLGVPKDSNFPLLGVWASPSHLAQIRVATPIIYNIFLVEFPNGDFSQHSQVEDALKTPNYGLRQFLGCKIFSFFFWIHNYLNKCVAFEKSFPMVKLSNFATKNDFTPELNI